MNTLAKFIPLVTIVLFCIGCEPQSQAYVNSARLDRGLVVVLPGVEGCSPFNEAICDGLNAGGVDCAIELYDWTAPYTPIYNLRAESRNRMRASDLAARIARYHMTYPGRPVVLVGQSGGGAIAIWTAESLMPGETVDGVIMLAASLSPEYPLDAAMAGVKRGMVNFYSSRDWVLLGVGTTLAGTMDREFGSSAGRLGFQIPDTPLRREKYSRLYQVPWQHNMTDSGNPGLHLTSGSAGFVAKYVAPLVLAKEWDMSLIVGIEEGIPPIRQADRRAAATSSPVRPTTMPMNLD